MTSDELNREPADDPTGESSVHDEMADYLQVYLDETDDELEAIVQSLLTLETQPQDRAALNEAFRLLHTLKGSAGMMGFASVSELAHLLENRFESFRSGQETIGGDVMAVLLACVDYLKGFNLSLRRGETPDNDISRLSEQLAALESVAGVAEPALQPPQPQPGQHSVPVQNTLMQEGAYRVTVEFEPHLQLADLKARLIVARLARVGEIVATEPQIDDIQTVDDLSGFSVVVMCARDPAEVRAIADVDGVREVRIEGRAMHTSDSLSQSAESLSRPAPPAPSPAVAEPVAEPVAESDTDPVATAEERAETATVAETAADPPPELREVERDASSVTATVRVDIERLDRLMNLTGELVVNRARFAQIADSLGRGRIAGSRVRDLKDRMRQKLAALREQQGDHDHVAWKELESDLCELDDQTESWDRLREQCGEIVEAVDQLKRVSSSIQQGVLETRMVPIAPLFSRFRRVIRDLSTERSKKVRLRLDGEKTELDKRMIDELGDPLIHLVRNSIDHGIESTEDRLRLGKQEQGTISLSASHSGNNVLITVSDDGAGIDVDRVRRRVIARRLASETALNAMSEQEILDHIWLPGFSTAEQVTEISGRGVGLDVVRERIMGLNGTIELTTQPGEGSTFHIRLPLTLAIMRSLLVRFRSGVFSIPIDDVREIVAVPASQVQHVHLQRTIDVRGEFVRITSLAELFHWNTSDSETGLTAVADGKLTGEAVPGADESRVSETSRAESAVLNVVMIRSGDRTLGLCVDELLGSSDMVIKSLSDNFREIPGLSGASVLGTGAVSLMLDVHALIQLA